MNGRCVLLARPRASRRAEKHAERPAASLIPLRGFPGVPPEVHRDQPAAGSLDLRNHPCTEHGVGISLGAIAWSPPARGPARSGVDSVLLLQPPLPLQRSQTQQNSCMPRVRREGEALRQHVARHVVGRVGFPAVVNGR